MSWRGVNLLAVLALLLLVSGLGLAGFGAALGSWELLGAGAVATLGAVSAAVLAVLEDVL